MYVHHGLYHEASYYSERAIFIAESVGSTVLWSRLKSHRSRLLTLAGLNDEAELCLAQDDAISLEGSLLARIDRDRAKAYIHTKQGSLQEALRLYNSVENYC